MNSRGVRVCGRDEGRKMSALVSGRYANSQPANSGQHLMIKVKINDADALHVDDEVKELLECAVTIVAYKDILRIETKENHLSS